MIKHDPLNCALEIREQLASEKRKLAFFFGAGTSMAVGLPGIDELTELISKHLKEPYKTLYENFRKKLPEKADVEMVLNKIRIIRELMNGREDEEFYGLKGSKVVKDLDSAICNAICDIVGKEPSKELKTHLIFSHWLRMLHAHRDYPVEIFTTNYDLLLEQAMEKVGLPFFDGFVGSVSPFFAPESVEAEEDMLHRSVYPPTSWTRLWKIHGSINWKICANGEDDLTRIIRLSGVKSKQGEELVIFPSHEKYVESRKLPYIAFQDRLRRFLNSGEALIIIAGYSFSDQHINQIIFQGLRSNPKLAVTALVYGEKEELSSSLKLPQKCVMFANEYRNLTIYGPDRASIGGIDAPWGEPSRKPKAYENWQFWDDDYKQFTLGDFNLFVSFLELFVGFEIGTLSTGSESEDDTSRKQEQSIEDHKK